MRNLILTFCLYFFMATPPLLAGEKLTQPVDYSNHRVLRVELPDEAAVLTLGTIVYDIWSHHVGVGEVVVLASRQEEAALNLAGLKYEVQLEDVVGAANEQMSSSLLTDGDFFTAFHPLDEIEQFIFDLEDANPGLVDVFQYGETWLDRPMYAMRISGADDPSSKPGVLYLSCQHSREWITPPMTLYLANYLVSHYDTDPEITDLVDNLDWIFVPIANPDGYVFTWDADRMWRKNRHGEGVDLNRNWDYEWGGEGSSGSPSSPTYRGPFPFSEPESQALRDLIQDNPNILVSIDYHSFSQLVLWPWGYTDDLTPDHDLFNFLGQTMSHQIEDVYGLYYEPGTIYSTIYPVSGGAKDWIYGERDIIGFGWELRDTGQFGFLLPPTQIIPTCEENLQAAMTLASWARAPMKVEYPDGVPLTLPPAQDNLLTVKISPRDESVMPGTVQLHSRNSPEDPFAVSTMTSVGNDEYEGIIPPAPCNTEPEFYVAAIGSGGTALQTPGGIAPGAFKSELDLYVEVLEEPENRHACIGDSVMFDVVGAAATPMTYQWFKASQPIPGETDSTLIVDPVTAQSAGNYFAAVHAACSMTTSPAAALILDNATIVGHPQSRDVCIGATTGLNVVAQTPVPVSYQWYFDGESIPGATSSILPIFGATLEDAGSYHAVATTYCGASESNSALINVLTDGPSITEGPGDLSICPGGGATLSVAAGGGTMFSYQWMFDGVPIDGATESSLTLSMFSVEQAGEYSVQVTNACGSVTSEVAEVATGGCLTGDSDGDGDVDLVDFGNLQLCFTGPTASATGGCLDFDFDGDGDVDLVDFGAFQLVFTGSL
jgi:murein tripeptide amidase MpaA